jgi:hypothetical protein
MRVAIWRREDRLIYYSGDVLSRDIVTAVPMQLKNDQIFDDEVSDPLFRSMDPFLIGIKATRRTEIKLATSIRTTFDAPGCPRRHSLLWVVTSSLIGVQYGGPLQSPLWTIRCTEFRRYELRG